MTVEAVMELPQVLRSSDLWGVPLNDDDDDDDKTLFCNACSKALSNVANFKLLG